MAEGTIICERYRCPDCGVMIFCRRVPGEGDRYFRGADMRSPIETCPGCEKPLAPAGQSAKAAKPAATAAAKAASGKAKRVRLNKGDMVGRLFEASEEFTSKAAAERALDAVLHTVADALAAGEDVALQGFGRFSIRKRKARRGKNPRTGEEMTIPARTVVGFSASKQLDERIEE